MENLNSLLERANLQSSKEESASSFDLKAHGEMKAAAVNQTAGDLGFYNCSICLNRGYIAIPTDEGNYTSRECDCVRIRRCVQKMEQSGLKNVIRDYTFDAFHDAEAWQKQIKQGAVTYADAPEGWLLFCGQSGSGKTHLCTAVCRQRLLRGDEVIYMPWRDDIAQLKSLSLDNEKRDRIVKEFKTAQILYIDDLFKTGRTADGFDRPTGADINLAFEILNYRYINRLLTIVSTEKSPMELLEIDEATGGRILEMARGKMYEIGKNKSRNYRLRGLITV